jgi:exopolyphosphatase/guanosine-5'-triphosphate,3'-diphosphate pyrophosphatase
VIDIGSNSARVVVYRRDAAGRLRMLAGSRAALRLVRDVDRGRRLSDESIERALRALADFRALAEGAGATRIQAVATAAMRDAVNGPQFIERARRELGLLLEVIDGEAEARYGFLGAIQGLPVDDGQLFDLGGGSMQVIRFRERRLVRSWSLPLGSLRLSSAFLARDPPTRGERERLRRHVAKSLRDAALPALRRDEALVGTGGTVRNLAKIDARARGYPIRRVHGYLIERRQLREIAARLARTRASRREAIPGLSGERSDSIVGGALAIETLAEALGARGILISGQGVREGVAASHFEAGLRSAREVRAASVASLALRFDGWRAAAADRRQQLAQALLAALDPGASAELEEALVHSARLLDIGRSVDFFDRHRHAAEMVLAAEMDGFSHREIALLAAVLLASRERDAELKPYAPLLAKPDRGAVERAAVVLALSDDIEERCRPGAPVSLRCSVGKREARVSVPSLLAWRPRGLAERFERAFGRRLDVRPGGG